MSMLSPSFPPPVFQHRGRISLPLQHSGFHIITNIYLQTIIYHTSTIFAEVFILNYKDYQNARDAAWRILLDCHIDQLPVDLNVVCKVLGVRAVSYKVTKELIAERGLSGIVEKSDGLTFYAKDTPVILYNESCVMGRIRFTVAHELGHIILGHVSPGSVTTVNREPSPGDDPHETAANQFAARLLAPACVLWGLGLHTPEEIAKACHISNQAARFRANRMQVLYARNKFLSSPLEQRLYQQFLPFIKGEVHCR